MGRAFRQIVFTVVCLSCVAPTWPFLFPLRPAGFVSVRPPSLVRLSSSRDGAGGPQERISISSDSTQTMKRVIEGVLAAKTAEEASAVLGEHVTYLLDGKTPERFRKARAFFPFADSSELDEVFSAIVDFLEAFVDSTSSVEKRYQLMTRELIEAAKEGDRAFDRQVNSYGAALNFEFLQYLDGQMDELSKMDPERRDLLGEDAPNIALLRMLRVRVNAMLDETFGPYFAELTRIIAIDDDAVRRRAFLNSGWIHGGGDGDDEGQLQGGLVKLLKYVKREMEEDQSNESRRAVDRQVLHTRISELLYLLQRMEQKSS